MVKDRLPEFLAAQRASGKIVDDDVDETNNSFMAEFYTEVEEIHETINKIEINIEKVKKKYSTIFLTLGVNKKPKIDLEELMCEIKDLIIKVIAKLKLMKQNIEIEKYKNKSSIKLKIREVQYLTLSRKFINILREYNQIQINYKEQCKKRIHRQLEIVGKTATNEELEKMLKQGEPDVFIQEMFVNTQLAKQNLTDIESEHTAMVKIENSIKEIHDIFVDMYIMIENQGEMIDRIEHHIEHASDRVQSAAKETKKSVKQKCKSRRRKWIFSGVAGISIAFIIFMIILL